LTGDTIACDLHAHRFKGGFAGYLRLAEDLPPAAVQAPALPSVRFKPESDVFFATYAQGVLAGLTRAAPAELAIRLRRFSARAGHQRRRHLDHPARPRTGRPGPA
jgi:hypothetical protein